VNPELLLNRLKTLGAAFSTAQLVSLAGTFLVVVAVIAGGAWWLNAPSYQALFTDLDPESAGRVTQRLQTQDVPYQLAQGGQTIMVPQERIDELRLDFAVNGLPTSGRMGFEIFDTTQFGATEFLEQVNLRRALEGEIARTIGTITEVAGARVHIAMAKEHLFAADQEPAKASVVLKLRSSRPPMPATIQGIAALVAAAVEGLRPESVVIMDTTGRPLTTPMGGTDDGLGHAQMERQRAYEQQLASQVVSLLEPVVGVGGVRANVAARMFLESEEQVQEVWGDPVIRSQSTSVDGSAGPGAAVGIAGARANLPGPVPPGQNEPSPPTLAQATTVPPVVNPLRTSETTNFEIGKTVTRTERPRGGVARLSVAVLVDDERYVEQGADGASVPQTRPRDAEQLMKLQELVTMAVGLDVTRGDQLTVQNIAFDEGEQVEIAEPGLMERFTPLIIQVLRVVTILVLGALALMFVARPLLRRVVLEAHPVEQGGMPRQLPKTVEEIEGEIAAQLAASPLGDRRLPVLTKRLTGLAQQDPEVAARLVRTWLVDDKS
jgi:flagellar M-ring protein FliF